MHAIAREVINNSKSFDHNLQFFSFECYHKYRIEIH